MMGVLKLSLNMAHVIDSQAALVVYWKLGALSIIT